VTVCRLPIRLPAKSALTITSWSLFSTLPSEILAWRNRAQPQALHQILRNSLRARFLKVAPQEEFQPCSDKAINCCYRAHTVLCCMLTWSRGFSLRLTWLHCVSRPLRGRGGGFTTNRLFARRMYNNCTGWIVERWSSHRCDPTTCSLHATEKKIIIGGEILALKPRIVFLGYRESMATITLKQQEPMNSRWREGVCSSY